MAKILVVDDESSVRSLVSAVLRNAGYEVVTADSAGAAQALCEGCDCPDLVICDIMMPSMDGHQLTAWIAPRCPRTRVLHLSGYDSGCDTCPYVSKCPLVAKPFTSGDLVAAVEAALRSPPTPLKPELTSE